MELTKREIEIADRYISKRERQVAQWPIKRWIILVVFSASMLFGYKNVSDGMRTIDDDKDMGSQVSRSLGDGPPPGLEKPWIVGSIIKTSKILEARYQLVTYAMMQVALGYIQIIAGAIMVGLALVRWNSGERDAIICKLLRSQLQELERSVAANIRPLSN